MAAPTTPEEYLATLTPEARAAVEQIRATVHEAVADVGERVSYQILGFTSGKKILMYAAGWAEHVSVYPIPPGDAAFEAAVAPYRASKGTLRFPLSEPLPLDVVAQVARQHAIRLGG